MHAWEGGKLTRILIWNLKQNGGRSKNVPVNSFYYSPKFHLESITLLYFLIYLEKTGTVETFELFTQAWEGYSLLCFIVYLMERKCQRLRSCLSTIFERDFFNLYKGNLWIDVLVEYR